MLPGNSEVLGALGKVNRREGHWEESVAYFEQALALDPRNVELLGDAADTYVFVRQLAAALKLVDRILDITPNHSRYMAWKAGMYQAQGNLQEAAKLLSEIKEQTRLEGWGAIKVAQLTFERNYEEAVRSLQARLDQFHYSSEFFKTSDQLLLAFTQRLAGDMAGAKVTAEKALNTLEQLYREQPDNVVFAVDLSKAYAVMGEKDSALNLAERATLLLPSAEDAVNGPTLEENLALIQTIVGENSRAISTLNQLLKTPYDSWVYVSPITPALLRLDPLWDPLRADPAFQKLCEEKQK